MTAQAKRPGRPVLPPDQRRTVDVHIRMSEDEKREYDARGGAKWFREQLRVPLTHDEINERTARALLNAARQG